TVLSLNPEIANADTIHPGVELKLPGASREVLGGYAEAELQAAMLAEMLEQSEEKRKAAEPFSTLMVQTQFSYSAWQGVDTRDNTTATLLSRTNAGAQITWTQNWNACWKTFQSVGFTRYEIAPDTGSNLPIRNATLWAPRYTLGGIYSPHDGMELGALVGYSQQLYYHSETAVLGVTLDGLMAPVMEIWWGQRLLKLKPFDVRAELRVLSVLPVSNSAYSTHFGLGYRARIEIGQTFQAMRVFAGGGFTYLNQNSSILQLNRRDIGFEVGIQWRLGK
ncbi:hypothetical protein K2X33_03815, partial [bacterium]|nr:hypothetical protein [bacterium]